MTKSNYKKFNRELINTLYYHLKFIAQVIPIELSIEQFCDDINLKNKLRQKYINEKAPSVLTTYRLNENHVFISEILLKIDSLYKDCLAKGDLHNSVTIYCDFILKWNNLMASSRGKNLIALFEKNKFEHRYQNILNTIKRQSELKILETIAPIKMFHESFEKFINLFILPKEDL